MSDREEITSEAKKAAGLTEEDYESKRALKVAQATVSSLQVCMNEPFRISHVHLSHHILYPGHWETGDVKVSQLSLPKIYFFQR